MSDTSQAAAVAAVQGAVGTLVGFVWLVMWVAGCVLAKGFWSTLFAVITGGLWSFYLVIERALQAIGWA